MICLKLYGKESVLSLAKAMSGSGRFVHSYIITGEKGTGKKTSAKYLAMQLLCDNNSACGECRQCRRILNGQHPDFITVPKEGKNYLIGDIRTKVVEDSITAPNDCDRKIYFLPDCDGWQDQAQNALLKVTEDPPDPVYFIFTAMTKSTFLPTLISRSMTIEIPETDRETCIAALSDRGEYTPEQISEAAELFGGNIGRCIDYLEGDAELRKAAETVRLSVDAIINRDEYSLAAVLNKASGGRSEMRYALEMLARAIRDGAGIRSGGSVTLGCTPSGSKKMAERINTDRLLEMYDAVCEASVSCTRNCNAAVTAAVLAGKLCG